MNHDVGKAFDSIESAHEFLRVLLQTVGDSRRDLEADIQRESANLAGMNGDRERAARHLDALRIAAYNVEKLQAHLAVSSRLLNDLRSLRRLLFEERPATAPVAQKSLAKAIAVTATPAGAMDRKKASAATSPPKSVIDVVGLPPLPRKAALA